MAETPNAPVKVPPKVVEGVTFRCYQIGFGVINRWHWVTDDGRIFCAANYGRLTYYAVVDGENLDKRFRSLDGAMRAGVIEMALNDMHKKEKTSAGV